MKISAPLDYLLVYEADLFFFISKMCMYLSMCVNVYLNFFATSVFLLIKMLKEFFLFCDYV